jgi:hypothetical protein
MQAAPALPAQVAARLTAAGVSQGEAAARLRELQARQRARRGAVTDINEAIALLRGGHIVECAPAGPCCCSVRAAPL